LWVESHVGPRSRAPQETTPRNTLAIDGSEANFILPVPRRPSCNPARRPHMRASTPARPGRCKRLLRWGSLRGFGRRLV